MPAYRTLGTDSSGRPIRMSPEMATWWTLYCDRLGFTPTITQGGWLTNAAAASATTHAGDALDMRVWDRTQKQVQAMVREGRALGAAAWLRNKQHGGFSDPHVHLVPGRWAHPSPSALRQWDALKAGRNGLASNGPDYHPYPLADRPPEDDMADAKDDIIVAIKDSQRAVGLALRDNRKALGLLVRAVAKDLDANDQKILDELLKD